MATLRAISNRLVWRDCTPHYAAKVGDHSYVVHHRTIDEADWKAFADALAKQGEWSPPGAPSVRRRYRYLLPGDGHRYWIIGPILNRVKAGP